MTRRKVDTTDTAEWGWLNDPEVEAVVQEVVDTLASRFSTMDRGDLYQEAVLYVAVRPELVALAVEHNFEHFRWRVSRGLYPAARTSHRRAWLETNYEDLAYKATEEGW